MQIQTLHLIEGAKQARGLTVVIDVFRAFSLECYLYSFGAKEIWPVGSVETARALKAQYPDAVLIGERGGKMCEGFDFGNSPSTVIPERVCGRTVIHTTSAGTQGIVNAQNADEIVTGSLVNAKAIAKYIRQKNPNQVSLVCMGNSGVRPAKEDELCAQYLHSLLIGAPLADIEARAKALEFDGGDHFFDPDRQHIYPKADFFRCIEIDKFDFVLRVENENGRMVSRKITL